MKIINIKTIRIDGGTQSRVEINNEIVTEYAEAIKAGAEFPAVIVFNDGANNWLADGFHRFHAHNQAGKTSISAEVRQGTARDAVLYSLGANGTHGLNRTNADKRKSVTTMLNDAEWSKWSSNAIAKACGVSHTFVDSVRSSILQPLQDTPATRTVERNGKTYEQNTANIGKPLAQIQPEEKPALAAVPVLSVVPPEDEYTPLDEAQDHIHELQAMLAVANMGDVSEDDKEQAKNLIAELTEENRKLRANLKAVTTSRDSLMNELAMVKRQCINLQAKLKKAA